ncbi:MAG: hypothetical protein J6V44_03550 [Methanobrevibacter sp.]|nr:hypothetical protein [Methanobrevibacter sp.]
MTDIWEEKVPHETTKAFGYFTEYLKLGLNRTMTKLQKKMEKEGDTVSLRTLKRYKDKYQWLERAEAYDMFKAEQNAIKLKMETDSYFDLKRKELQSYEDIYQAITASIVEGIMDGTIDPLKASKALKTLAEANLDISKLHLRLFGEPAEIQQINTKNESMIETNEGFDVLNSDWMNNELEIMKQLVNKDR